jgi:hypothetical protein
MNQDYDDIRSRIPEPPKWWDEEAVPRYCDFHPKELANIYASEAALVGITCQGCGERFKVAFARDRHGAILASIDQKPYKSIAELIRSKELHYGDPPNTGCCPAGATMNSEPRRVLEYWSRPELEWARDPALEVDIEPNWIEDGEAA